MTNGNGQRLPRHSSAPHSRVRRHQGSGAWRRRRPVVEFLEPRTLLSTNIATFPLRVKGGFPQAVASGAGADQHVWYTLSGNNGISGSGSEQHELQRTDPGSPPTTPNRALSRPDRTGSTGSSKKRGPVRSDRPEHRQIKEIPFSPPRATGRWITAGPKARSGSPSTTRTRSGDRHVKRSDLRIPALTPAVNLWDRLGPDSNIWFTEAGVTRSGGSTQPPTSSRNSPSTRRAAIRPRASPSVRTTTSGSR